ncbi:SipW-dependent-type signal peptide-containing protein [Marisediminicola sp. LYQ85]|uniref:SipW-dependent-type signal peptide-containing protein n=1 Tax=Marisediminicola sp. LYQ85 TaxID=3391062 RepID=UPI003982DB82
MTTSLHPSQTDTDTGAALSATRPSPRAHRRGPRARAVLAGGLVLGVGAAITLAAWNDSEFATGVFTSGSFNLEGNEVTAAGPYSDHAEPGDAAALTFTAPFDNLAPDDVVYSGYWLRLAAGTTVDATLAVESIATTVPTAPAVGNEENLSYDIYSIPSGSPCGAAAVAGETPIASGADLTSNAAVASDTVDLTQGATVDDAGSAVQLCIVVTANDDLEQSVETTSTWQFTATSVDG